MREIGRRIGAEIGVSRRDDGRGLIVTIGIAACGAACWPAWAGAVVVAVVAGYAVLQGEKVPEVPPAVAVVAVPEAVATAFVPGEAAGTAVPIHVAGRVAADKDWPAGFRHVCRGVVVEATFSGNWVEMRLVDPINRWRVTVDDAVVELTRPGDGVFGSRACPRATMS